jgi:hypothetical protein
MHTGKRREDKCLPPLSCFIYSFKPIYEIVKMRYNDANMQRSSQVNEPLDAQGGDRLGTTR